MKTVSSDHVDRECVPEPDLDLNDELVNATDEANQQATEAVAAARERFLDACLTTDPHQLPGRAVPLATAFEQEAAAIMRQRDENVDRLVAWAEAMGLPVEHA